jgi:hypothetical protein
MPVAQKELELEYISGSRLPSAKKLLSVLAHERAHLRGRHHLLLRAAEGLHQAFPRVAAFREARRALGRLAEMLADDTASRHSGRLTVATTLVCLAEHSMIPTAALGAGGDSALPCSAACRPRPGAGRREDCAGSNRDQRAADAAVTAGNRPDFRSQGNATLPVGQQLRNSPHVVRSSIMHMSTSGEY